MSRWVCVCRSLLGVCLFVRLWCWFLLVSLSTIMRYCFAADITLAVNYDASYYAASAQSIWKLGRFLFCGEFNYGTSPLYPLMISPAYYFNDFSTNFSAVKALNSFYFSSAAVPLYLIAKRLFPLGGAIVCTCLALLTPEGSTTFRIMTESLSFPLCWWAIYLICLSVVSPRFVHKLALGAVLAACAATKHATLLLFVAYIVCELVCSNLVGKGDRGTVKGFVGNVFRSFVSMLPAVFVFVVLYLAYVYWRSLGSVYQGTVLTYKNLPYFFWYDELLHSKAFAESFLSLLRLMFFDLFSLIRQVGIVTVPFCLMLLVGISRDKNRFGVVFSICSVLVLSAVVFLSSFHAFMYKVPVNLRHGLFVLPFFIVLSQRWFMRCDVGCCSILWRCIFVLLVVCTFSALWLSVSSADDFLTYIGIYQLGGGVVSFFLLLVVFFGFAVWCNAFTKSMLKVSLTLLTACVMISVNIAEYSFYKNLSSNNTRVDAVRVATEFCDIIKPGSGLAFVGPANSLLLSIAFNQYSMLCKDYTTRINTGEITPSVARERLDFDSPLYVVAESSSLDRLPFLKDGVFRLVKMTELYSVFYCDRLWDVDTLLNSLSIPLLVDEGYRGFNIILAGNKYIGLPQGEQALDMRKVRDNLYPFCIVSNSFFDCRHQIDFIAKSFQAYLELGGSHYDIVVNDNSYSIVPRGIKDFGAGLMGFEGRNDVGVASAPAEANELLKRFEYEYQLSLPPVLVKEFTHYNVVKLRLKYYVISHALGPLDLQSRNLDNLSGVLEFDNAADAENEAERLTKIEEKKSPPRLVKEADECNVVAYGGVYYVVPHALGNVDLANEASIHSLKLQEFARVEDAVQSAQSCTKAARVDPAPHLLLSLLGNNIVLFKGQYYVVPQKLGALDLTTLDVSSKPGIASFESFRAALWHAVVSKD